MTHAVSWNCPSCGHPGKLVPASLGDPAFWICVNTHCHHHAPAPMPDDSLKHYGLHDGPSNRLPSPRGQTHYEGCERTAGHHGCALAKLDAAQAEAAEWAWRAYRSGYLDGISNPEPYEKLGYEKTVALAEAGATAYCAMCRIAAVRAQP